MRTEFCIDILTPNDADELFALRASAYQRHYGADVDVSALTWSTWDGRFINLGLFHKGKLASALRVMALVNPEEYLRTMLVELDTKKFETPIMVLNRAATTKDFESLGHHSLLRLQALRLAQACEIRWVSGTFLKSSHRINQLKELGYEFSINPMPWDDFLKSHEPTYVVHLDLKANFEKAEQRLLEKVNGLQAQYPVGFDFEHACNKLLKSASKQLVSF